MRVSQFRPYNGDRIGIQNIAIIVTNSVDNEVSVVSEAQLAMQDGIVLLAMSISGRVLSPQLSLFASPPWGNIQSYFPAPLNNDLTINRQIILNRTCLAASQSLCQGKVSSLTFEFNFSFFNFLIKYYKICRCYVDKFNVSRITRFSLIITKLFCHKDVGHSVCAGHKRSLAYRMEQLESFPYRHHKQHGHWTIGNSNWTDHIQLQFCQHGFQFGNVFLQE